MNSVVRSIYHQSNLKVLPQALVSPIRCGICVVDTKEQEENDAMDECGVCYGENACLGCDNVPYSGKVMDRCGLCLKPDSPLFNSK